MALKVTYFPSYPILAQLVSSRQAGNDVKGHLKSVSRYSVMIHVIHRHKAHKKQFMLLISNKWRI